MTAVRGRSWRSFAFVSALAIIFSLLVPFEPAQAQVAGDDNCQLQVTPETDTNPTGTTHTLVATVSEKDGGAPAGFNGCDAEALGYEIDFEIESGPAVTGVPTSTSSNTNTGDSENTPTSPDLTCTATAANPPEAAVPAWSCSVSFTSSQPGTNVIRAWIDDDRSNATVDADTTEGRDEATAPGDRTEVDDTDVVSKTWFTALVPNARLDCDDANRATTATSPALSHDRETNRAGESELYTCKAYQDNNTNGRFDAGDAVLSGQIIDAEIAGTGGADNGPNDPDNRGYANAANTTADVNNACTTDANGECTYTFAPTESENGVAELCFWIDGDNDGEFNGQAGGDDVDGNECRTETVNAGETATNDWEADDTTDKVEKTWAAPVATTVDANPEIDNNKEGTQHTVTATVFDQFGQPVAGARVDFDIEGRNDSGALEPEVEANNVVTNASGVATFTYTDTGADITGNNTDQDVISVCLDGSQATDQTCSAAEGTPVEPAEPEDQDTVDTVIKNWFDTVPTAGRIELDMEDLNGAFGADGCPAGGDFDEVAATNQLTSIHEVCAQTSNQATGGTPIGGQEVTFTISGPGYFTNAAGANLGKSYTTSTDSSGDAYAYLTSTETGTSTVTATSGTLSDTGTKPWANQADEARNIDCDPEDATNPTGTSHVVTCKVTDRYGNPVPGVDVSAAEVGPGRVTATSPTNGQTNANGEIEFVVATTPGEEGEQTITGTITEGGTGRPGGGPAGNPNDACEQAAGVLDAQEKGGPVSSGASPAPAGNCTDDVKKTWSDTAAEPECNDGVDNDGDGFTDFPEDPGCVSPDDNTEDPNPGITEHARSVEITKFKHIKLPGKKKPALMVKGVVTSNDGYADCQNFVPIKVQLKASGEWITRKADFTNQNGRFKVLIRHVQGKYRAVASPFSVFDADGNEDRCLRAADKAKHKHRR